jgi:undecaprenyl-diphosphatase
MLEAILLGLVQGLTEFLPVSSSGHLVVVPYLFRLPQPSLAMGVALHIGTLVAGLAYFACDLAYLATRSVGVGVVADGEAARARRTVMLLAVGTLPAAAIGFAFNSTFEELFGGPQAPRFTAVFLMVTAGLLTLAETVRRRRAKAQVGVAADEDPSIDLGRDESTVGWTDVVAIGFAQALAILPGISRAGATMAAGMLRGLSREGAARFSFLLSIPVIAGAGLYELVDRDAVATAGAAAYSTAEIGVGMLVAAASGFWAIRFLLRLVSTDDLLGFARYVFLLGVFTLLGTVWLGPVSQV